MVTLFSLNRSTLFFRKTALFARHYIFSTYLQTVSLSQVQVPGAPPVEKIRLAKEELKKGGEFRGNFLRLPA